MAFRTNGYINPARLADSIESEYDATPAWNVRQLDGSGMNIQQHQLPDDYYIVEKIVDHRFTSTGQLEYTVKWSGYDDPNDETIEPYSHLASAPQLVEDYHRLAGLGPVACYIAAPGKRDHTPRTKHTNRQQKHEQTPCTYSSTTAHGSDAVTHPKFPKDNWDEEIENIVDLKPLQDTRSGGKKLFAYILFKNKKHNKCIVSLGTLRKMSPQKLIDHLLESRLKSDTTTPVEESRLPPPREQGVKQSSTVGRGLYRSHV